MKNLLEIAKIFVLALLVIVPAKVSAVDYYVGNYKGAEKYLMTETIERHYEIYSDGTGMSEYFFKVKAVYKNSNKINYISYRMMADPHFEFTKNGSHYGFRDAEIYAGTVEKNLVNYIVRVVYKNRNPETVPEYRDYEKYHR